ncbi:IS701 family transposase [Streptomyces sp. 900105755]|uniref:IS701 family transposase n=1 Tax=Streptomyces sp. 900105755 TaxID=3154389 RepID=UPI00332B83D9
MSDVASPRGLPRCEENRPGPAAAALPPAADAVLTDLCERLFDRLPRSDQRARGLKYVKGLLITQGRRSFRNMAAHLGGGPTLEQRLHHFVSCSTWDWMPMRRTLAAYMAELAPPRAWVLRPLLVPKEGDNTVGVHKRYVPALGQMLNAQYSVGLWAASSGLPYPVSWRLLLPREWLDDAGRRAQVAIPDGHTAETPVECAVEAYLDLAAHQDGALPVRPVVVAVGDADAATAVRRLRAGDVPFVVAADRRPAARDGLDGLSLFHTETTLDGGRGRAWLTNMRDAGPAELTALTGLVGAVDESFGRITDRVGMTDFTGRTFNGWNRHATLASAAHCVTLLSARAPS